MLVVSYLEDGVALGIGGNEGSAGVGGVGGVGAIGGLGGLGGLGAVGVITGSICCKIVKKARKTNC